MNTSSIVEILPNVFMNSIIACYLCQKISGLKINFHNFTFYICFILLNFCLLLNNIYCNNFVKVIVITICLFIFLKCTFIKATKNAIITTLLFQVIIFCSELLFTITITIIFRQNTQSIISNYLGSFLPSVIIMIIAYLISLVIDLNLLYKKLVINTRKIELSTLSILFLVLIVSVNLFLAISYYRVHVSIVLAINITLIIIYSYIILKYIEQKNRYIDINDKYSLSEASLKEVQNNVNRLMALNHENKNQLITIRTMVANKDKDVLKNIDAIIDQKIKDDKELKIRTSVISNTMLGSLIYSKLLTMKENNITHNLHISKAINKSHLINLGDKTNVDICKIVGVYLDNAIEAVMEAEVKEINIDLYLEDNYFCISIANTFKGKVNLDTITDYGYTTKSNGHGYGLSLVKEVIKDNNALSSKTDIIDNKVFVQNLKIKM